MQEDKGSQESREDRGDQEVTHFIQMATDAKPNHCRRTRRARRTRRTRRTRK